MRCYLSRVVTALGVAIFLYSINSLRNDGPVRYSVSSRDEADVEEHDERLVKITTTSRKITDPAEIKEKAYMSEEYVHVSTTAKDKAKPQNYKTQTALSNSKLKSQNYSVSTASKSPHKHFFFVKIEKTGSSTLFATFARFIKQHNLNMMAPVKGAYHISWAYGRDVGWVIGPKPDSKPDVLINHAKYNEEIITSYFPRDTIIIASFRHPVDWFESAVPFFSPSLHARAPEAVIRTSKLYTQRYSAMRIQTWLIIPQLQWLGFAYENRSNISIIQEFVKEMVKKIDIPIITERFDASLIILKRRLNWNLIDIVYKKLEMNLRPKLGLTPLSKQKLLSAEVNLGDMMLYEAMNASWWNQPEVKEKNFLEEVEYFKWFNKHIHETVCQEVKVKGENYVIPTSAWHQNITVTEDLCNIINRDKYDTLNDIVDYANTFKVSNK